MRSLLQKMAPLLLVYIFPSRTFVETWWTALLRSGWMLSFLAKEEIWNFHHYTWSKWELIQRARSQQWLSFGWIGSMSHRYQQVKGSEKQWSTCHRLDLGKENSIHILLYLVLSQNPRDQEQWLKAVNNSEIFQHKFFFYRLSSLIHHTSSITD